jgi:hypothetical protein
MPLKRRLPKARATLSAAQRAYLLGEDLPADAPFPERMRYVWLRRCAASGGAMPDGSASPDALRAAYAGEVLALRGKVRDAR